jgi:3-methyladenine DNA glycosylase/8-oxoguanine DNA glycosylase
LYPIADGTEHRGRALPARYGPEVPAIPDVTAHIRRQPVINGPLDLVSTTSPLRQGIDDPTIRVTGREVVRALRTQDGPATLHLRVDGGELVASAVGAGARAALDVAPKLAGLADNPGVLRPVHPALAEAQRRTVGLRLTSGTSVFDALVWVVMTQKVVGADARRAYRDLVRRIGDAAPGEHRLLLPPSAKRLAATPYWTFHECNVERRRATVIVNAAHHARTLDALAGLPAAEARRRLQSLPGVGPWTAAEVTAVSHGDADAVPLGDYHIPNVVAYALAGEPRATDERMLELLEPYTGQRGRVIRVLMAGGRGAPRFGPPLSRQDIRRR